MIESILLNASIETSPIIELQNKTKNQKDILNNKKKRRKTFFVFGIKLEVRCNLSYEIGIAFEW